MPIRTTTLVLVLALATGCGGVRRDWRLAERSQDPDAYEAFLAAWPGAEEAALAEERLEALRWEAAVEADHLADYEAHLAGWPDGPHAAEARAAIDRLTWRAAEASGELEPVDDYLTRWPEGAYVADARVLQEQRYWERAVTLGTPEGFGYYLAQWPEGRYAAEAEVARDDATYRQLAEVGTADRFRWYLERHPEGAHVAEAQAALDALLFHEVVMVVALRGTERASPRSSLAGLRRAVERSVAQVYRKAGYRVRVEAWDLSGREDVTHAFDLVRPRRGRGVVLIDVFEHADRAFERLAVGARIEATVTLHAGERREPVYQESIAVRSAPDAPDEYVDVVERLGSELYVLPLPVDAYRRTREQP